MEIHWRNVESIERGFRVGLNFEAEEEGLQATAVVPAPPDAYGL